LNAASHVDDTINKLQALILVKIPGSDEHYVANSDDEDNDSESDDASVAKIDSDGDASVKDSKVAEDSVNKANGSVTTLSKFWNNFENNGLNNGANVKRNKADAVNFDRLRGRFLQSLCDNLKQRFPSSELLEASACLNKSSWPTDLLERDLFGEKHAANLCMQFGMGSDETTK